MKNINKIKEPKFSCKQVIILSLIFYICLAVSFFLFLDLNSAASFSIFSLLMAYLTYIVIDDKKITLFNFFYLEKKLIIDQRFPNIHIYQYELKDNIILCFHNGKLHSTNGFAYSSPSRKEYFLNGKSVNLYKDNLAFMELQRIFNSMQIVERF